jgi:hypothetical protein
MDEAPKKGGLGSIGRWHRSWIGEGTTLSCGWSLGAPDATLDPDCHVDPPQASCPQRSPARGIHPRHPRPRPPQIHGFPACGHHGCRAVVTPRFGPRPRTRSGRGQYPIPVARAGPHPDSSGLRTTCRRGVGRRLGFGRLPRVRRRSHPLAAKAAGDGRRLGARRMKDWFSTLGRPELGGVAPWEHSDGRPVHDPDAHGGWFCAPP